MNDFFAIIYEIFISVFGDNLGSYLYGFCNNGDGGLYAKIGISVVLITVLFCVFFYFAFANSKRYKIKYWILFLLVSSFCSGLIAAYLPFIDLNSGFVCSQFAFDIENLIFFGIVNFFISGILFFALSMGLKFIGKAQARHTPF